MSMDQFIDSIRVALYPEIIAIYQGTGRFAHKLLQLVRYPFIVNTRQWISAMSCVLVAGSTCLKYHNKVIAHTCWAYAHVVNWDIFKCNIRTCKSNCCALTLYICIFNVLCWKTFQINFLPCTSSFMKHTFYCTTSCSSLTSIIDLSCS